MWSDPEQYSENYSQKVPAKFEIFQKPYASIVLKCTVVTRLCCSGIGTCCASCCLWCVRLCSCFGSCLRACLCSWFLIVTVQKTPFKPGSIPQSGFESSAQRPPSLTTDRSFSGVSMVAAVGASAGPSLVEDCELGRMFPTPPSTSTADSSVTTTAAGSANSLPGAILPGGSVLSAPGYYAVGSASAGATSPGVPHFQGSQYYSLSGGGSSSYTSTAYMDTSQQHQLNEQQQQQQHQQHQQQQQVSGSCGVHFYYSAAQRSPVVSLKFAPCHFAARCSQV